MENIIEPTETEKLASLTRSLAEYQQHAINAFTPPLYRDTDKARISHKFAPLWEWKKSPRGLGIIGKTGVGKSRAVYLMLSTLVASYSVMDFIRGYIRYDETVAQKHEGHRVRKQREIIREMSDYTHHWEHGPIPSIGAINDAALAKLVVSAMSFDNERGKEAVERLYKVDILFIDDLGQSKLTERVCAELYQIVEERVSHLRPIIFTSNFGGNQLAARFIDETRGSAVVRRLAEFCDVIKV